MAFELFPYQPERDSGVIAAYRRLARRRMPPFFFWAAFLLFGLFTILSYQESDDAESDTWSAMRTAHVEVALAVGAEDWPQWLRVAGGIKTVPETAADLFEGFSQLEDEALLTFYGRNAVKPLQEIATDSMGEVSVSELLMKQREGQLWAWDYVQARSYFAQEVAPDTWAAIDAEFASYARDKAIWSLTGSALWGLVLLGGLPFLPAAVRSFLPRNHLSLPLAAKVWTPSRATAAYMIAEFSVTILLLVSIDGLWAAFPMTTLFVYDAVWRLAGPLLMLLLLVVRWRHALRLLGLHLRPHGRLIAGMVSVGILFDFTVYHALKSFTPGEHLVTLSYWEEGVPGLFYALFASVILAPLAEEVAFRGVLFQSYLRRFGFGIAMGLSTLLFVVVHNYGIYGSFSVAFFGLGACALYRTTGSLWTAIIFHAVSNGLIVGASWPLYHGF